MGIGSIDPYKMKDTFGERYLGYFLKDFNGLFGIDDEKRQYCLAISCL